MPGCSAQDPRGYVKQVPLPISPQKCIKLQARGWEAYNLTVPTRDDVRNQNYQRRQQQILAQGFRSANHKPYRGIGDPFFLDQKKLILHALGQWNQSHDVDSDYSSSDDDVGPFSHAEKPTQRKTGIATKFVLRRTTRGLNTLNKEVIHGRKLIQNVKLGYKLFDLIKNDQEAKKAANAEEIQRNAEKRRMEWQPAKFESDSVDETDDELGEDVDIQSYAINLRSSSAGVIRNMEEETSVATEAESILSDDATQKSMVSRDIKSATSMRCHTQPKRKTPALRPYTPQHNNLQDSHNVIDASKWPIFRQLCILHWILESMNLDTNFILSPITTCWSLIDIGGAKSTVKKQHKERLVETKWETFLTNRSEQRNCCFFSMARTIRQAMILNKRIMDRISQDVRFLNGGLGPKSNKKKSEEWPYKKASTVHQPRTTQRRLASMYHHKHSVQSTSVSRSSSATTIGTPSGPGAVSEGTSLSEPINVMSGIDEEEDTGYASIFKFLDEYYNDLKKQAEDAAEAEASNMEDKDDGHKHNMSDHKQRERRSADKSARRSEKSRANSGRHVDTRSGLDDAMSDEESRPTSRMLRADIRLLRPKSSPALVEYQASLPSTTLQGLPVELKQKFADVREDKALTLHDVLEQIDRNRLKKCRSKYSHMDVRGSSFHRAVDHMRVQSARQLEVPAERRAQKQSVICCAWYTDLMSSLPYEFHNEWYLREILKKLATFGLQDSSSKQTIYKFVTVLKGLRAWEICSPDISSAIEFCREKIVGMTVAEYEEWFQEEFPTVSRPQTSPPVIKAKR